MIRYTIALRLKLGNTRYDFLAKTHNLPSPSTVNTYSSPSSNAPDWILYDSLDLARNAFIEKNTNLPETDWKRHGQLEWDSMATKE